MHSSLVWAIIINGFIGTALSSCKTELTGQSGEFTTKNYPELLYSSQCWNIKLQKDEMVTIRVLKAEEQPWDSCVGKLFFRSEGETSAISCNGKLDHPYTSHGSVVVRYNFFGGFDMPALKMHFKKGTSLSSCKTELTGQSGEFITKNYPELLYSSQCWNIRLQKDEMVTIRVLKAEEQPWDSCVGKLFFRSEGETSAISCNGKLDHPYTSHGSVVVRYDFFGGFDMPALKMQFTKASLKSKKRHLHKRRAVNGP